MSGLIARIRSRQQATSVVAIAGGALLLVLLLALNSAGVGAGASTPPVVLTAEGCNPVAIATAQLQQLGFSDGQFKVGESQIDWDAPEANERGAGAFGSAAHSTQEWVAWLGSDKEGAQDAQTFYAAQAGVSEEEILNPAYWVPFQISVDSTWEGNTQLVNGQMVDAGTRNSQAGDVGWYYVNPVDCAKVGGGEMPPTDARGTWGRGGCKNPQQVPPKPAQPTTPPTSVVKPPPTTTPKSPPTTTPTTPPTTVPCKKPEKPAVTDDRYDWVWNAAACKWEKRDNPFYQPPQNNPGQNTGPTPGAPQQPTVPPTGQTPPAGQPAPAPTPNGTDSGSPTQYPGGTTTDPNGSTSGGGPSGPTGGAPPVVDDGTHGGNPGGF